MKGLGLKPVPSVLLALKNKAIRKGQAHVDGHLRIIITHAFGEDCHIWLDSQMTPFRFLLEMYFHDY